MTHRPWSELTKDWSPERRAENERAKAKIRAHIRDLQSAAPADARYARSARSTPQDLAPSTRPLDPRLDHVRD